MISMKNHVTTAGLLAATALFLTPSFASADDGQKTFQTPEAAGAALLAAAKADDTAALVAIFGPESESLISSGDPVADKSRRDEFVADYGAKHHWSAGLDDSQVLDAGKTDWPFPIPLVDTSKGWRFDTARGQDEILNRRIGRNELGAIQACLAFVDAEQEYHDRNPLDGKPQYAQFIASSDDQKNGLYWPNAEGSEPSPLGAAFAAARAAGYAPKQGFGDPLYGYVYRVLRAQGAAAHGGAADYVVDGAMTKGFALLASPAKYEASGVMTFLVNQTGVIYEKDLGPDTTEIVSKIETFDPDESWDVVSAQARTPPR
ncbi:MAG: DUF2950 family protein [Candidatus Binatia bacterium]|nr:DUF2950 family protein [Candidatus Binatia bacterium]